MSAPRAARLTGTLRTAPWQRTRCAWAATCSARRGSATGRRATAGPPPSCSPSPSAGSARTGSTSATGRRASASSSASAASGSGPWWTWSSWPPATSGPRTGRSTSSTHCIVSFSQNKPNRYLVKLLVLDNDNTYNLVTPSFFTQRECIVYCGQETCHMEWND